MPRQTYTTKILNKDLLTTDVICLTIEKPAEYKYIAGQFIQIYIPDAANQNKEVLRSYSIASTPDETDLKFYIKLVDGGKAGEYLKKAQAGDQIKFGDAIGKFINTDTTSPLYFIATGVGMAPIIGLIRDELKNKKTTQPLKLLFGVRSEADIFLTDVLDQFKKEHKNFDYILTLSRPTENWKGEKGRVTDHLDKLTKQPGRYFICGNMAMITDICTTLEKQNIPKNNIHIEAL